MRINVRLILALLLFASGCSSPFGIASATKKVADAYEDFSRSPYHRGILYFENKVFAGRVPNKSLLPVDVIIVRFHDFLLLKEYHQAYGLFSEELKTKLPYDVFLEAIQRMDALYGKEYYFKIKQDPLVKEFSVAQKIFFKNALRIYDAVFCSYGSSRIGAKEEITYVFGVSRVDNNETKISSFGYQLINGSKAVEYNAVVPKANLKDKELIEKNMVVIQE